MSRRSFLSVYRQLSRCGDAMSNTAKLVLLNLLERLGDNQAVWPSQQTISRDTNIGETTVRLALRELETLGFITTLRRGLGQTNRYTVDLEALEVWSLNGTYLRSGTPDSVAQDRQVAPNRTPRAVAQARRQPPIEDPTGEDPFTEDLTQEEPERQECLPFDPKAQLTRKEPESRFTHIKEEPFRERAIREALLRENSRSGPAVSPNARSTA